MKTPRLNDKVVKPIFNIAAALLAVLFSPLASAQAYPAKPVRMIAASSPGGGVDT